MGRDGNVVTVDFVPVKVTPAMRRAIRKAWYATERAQDLVYAKWAAEEAQAGAEEAKRVAWDEAEAACGGRAILDRIFSRVLAEDRCRLVEKPWEKAEVATRASREAGAK
jgi:hypothetical protein